MDVAYDFLFHLINYVTMETIQDLTIKNITKK